MLRYSAGDAAAFDILYARHRAPLYRYFLRLAQPAAEELFQDVWMNVINARRRYQARAKFTTWLYRVAHNRLVDHYRRTSAGLPQSYDDDPQDVVDAVADEALREPESAWERRRLARRLMQSLDELPQAQRETFLLRAEAGLSLRDIAEATGTSAETAKSRLRYALARLRRALADENPALIRTRQREPEE